MIQDLKRILIHGMGMMGASLARALIDHPSFNGTIIAGVRTEQSAEVIKRQGLAHEVLVSPDPEHLNAIDPDFVVLGLPVLSVERLLPLLSFECPVTDMGSTRAVLEYRARQTGLNFVGSHPVCGSERNGPEAVVPGLYHGRLCLIIDGLREGAPDRDPLVLARVEEFWRDIGMRTYILDAETHDRMLAAFSHAPHFISSALSLSFLREEDLLRRNGNLPISMMGGGLRDMLRISGSNPEMWKDVMATNRPAILSFLEKFSDELNNLIALVRKENADWVIPYQREAKRARDQIYGDHEANKTPNHFP